MGNKGSLVVQTTQCGNTPHPSPRPDDILKAAGSRWIQAAQGF